MDDERAERVREWDTRSVESGYAGLRQLSGEEFSGAVEARRTTALLTNGRVVWIDGGDIEDFEGAALTAREAPDDALPLLFAMQERGGETRAQYYTEDTPLSEVNRTLEEGGFTGYVELSENVLSGDYYVVYHGGRSSSLAFVGNSRRLLTGDEAFERAADEVGIYEVVDATVEVMDIPGQAAGGGAAGGQTGSDRAAADAGADARADADDGAGTDATDAADPRSDATAPASSPDGRGSADRGGDAGRSATGADDAGRSATGADDGGQGPDEEIRVGAGLGTSDADEADEADAADGSDADASTDIAPAEAIEEAGEPADGAPGSPADVHGTGGEGPDATGGADPTAAPGRAGGTDDAGGPAPGTATDAGTGPASASGSADSRQSADAGAAARVADLEATRDRLEADLADAREELERVRDERDEYREEAERLRERVETLEARIEELEADETVEQEGPSLSPQEAIDGTNLFVRYRSKSDPTLEEATRGSADREAVNDNLRLEHHTTFETAGATVDDRPFETFLQDTLAYRFVQWVVRDLLYELRATGNEREMADLYDVLADVDRIELGGEVRVGEDDARQFDVVFRDRMSSPLAVADLHEGRTPASGDLVESLIDDATAVAGESDTIGSAFAVTTSYYEPPAHQAADDATGGGFLSRSNQKSYVKLDRSRGFHLCLVEARDGEFNLNVPEL
ncbi:MAG: hypothetical protein ABEH47_04660 [Haloferacaceae archaeon]